MTIRRYLFLLITGVLLLIAVIQVVLLLKFKQQVSEEVSMRGRLIADKVLEIAVDEFQIPQIKQHNVKQEMIVEPAASSKFVVLELTNKDTGKFQKTIVELNSELLNQPGRLMNQLPNLPENVRVDIQRALIQFQTKDPRPIKIEKAAHNVFIYSPTQTLHQMSQVEIKQQLKETIDKIYESNEQERIKVDVTHKVIAQPSDGSAIFVSTGQHSKLEGLHADSSPSLNLMVKYMLYSILVTTLLALILAFWLSRKFSAPLQNLITGFKQLEKGDFGTKVTPAGVNEVQQTIARFNTMSDQLNRLAAAEEKLQQQAHLQEIGDVSKGIAHALRNPMHTIGLAIEQLSDPALPDASKDKLMARIQNKLQQLNKSISALLTITTGEIDRSDSVDVNELLQDLILELKQSHDANSGTLKVTCEVPSNCELTGARSEIRSVLHTLIFNAYEASLENPEVQQVNITINVAQSSDQLVFTVIDNGLGLAKDIQQQLFQPHISSKAEGAGMGLYIAKRLTNLYYNGDLTLTNLEEKGCKATLTVQIQNSSNS